VLAVGALLYGCGCRGRGCPQRPAPPPTFFERIAGRRVGVVPLRAAGGAPAPRHRGAGPKSGRCAHTPGRWEPPPPPYGEPPTDPRARCQRPRPSSPPPLFPGHAAPAAGRPPAQHVGLRSTPRAPPHVVFGVPPPLPSVPQADPPQRAGRRRRCAPARAVAAATGRAGAVARRCRPVCHRGSRKAGTPRGRRAAVAAAARWRAAGRRGGGCPTL